jgi:DNA invertase Pin-like site-specific DNA recombinase
MVYGYARVSTSGQATYGNSLEDQEHLLRKNGATEIYMEHYTGTKTDRPKFTDLLHKLQSDDTLMVTKLDRFARTASEGSQIVKSLLHRGVNVHILNMGLIEDNPMGRLILTVMLAFAEFERDMIVERTQAGKAIARTKDGFREGRPEKYTPEQLRHALKLLESNSYTQVEKMTRISKSTLQRAKRAAQV